jgi:hypothetical protein
MESEDTPLYLISIMFYFFSQPINLKHRKCLAEYQFVIISKILTWYINATGGDLNFYDFRKKDWVDDNFTEDYPVSKLGFYGHNAGYIGERTDFFNVHMKQSADKIHFHERNNTVNNELSWYDDKQPYIMFDDIEFTETVFPYGEDEEDN